MKGQLRELALFAGAGGGILGGHLLGWKTVCAVECEPYCQQVLMQRQDDGLLPPFPIWSDVRTFEGIYWRGHVDVITGGFPCQDISAAGKGAGIEGERSGLWGQMARIVGEVRPRCALMENSPLLVGRGLAVVLSDLAALGYDARWCVLGADDVGAPHRRKRIWILAHAHGAGLAQRENFTGNTGQEFAAAERGGAVADSMHAKRWPSKQARGRGKQGQEGGRSQGPGELGVGGEVLADTDSGGFERAMLSVQRQKQFSADCSDAARGGQGYWWLADPADVGNADSEHGRPGTGGQDGAQTGHAGSAMDDPMLGRHEPPDKEVCPGRHPDVDASRWGLESGLGRVADGVADRVDRLRAIGNGQVPLVAATAWYLLGGPELVQGGTDGQ